MEFTELLKTELKPLYKDLLQSVTDYGEIAPFCLQWEKDYPLSPNEGILFIGRATNGWVSDSTDIKELFGDGKYAIFARKDQMKWVNNLEGNKDPKGYNTRKSAFWRVIKQVSEKVYPDKWYDNIAWSNLCKIAPSEGGNPSDSLYYSQLKDCQLILKKEIEILSPKYVIMLVGQNWAKDFMRYLNDNQETHRIETVKWGNYEVIVYAIKGAIYLISEHPMGKPEQVHIEALNSLISNLHI